jgi:hypothetical protein
MVYNLNGCSYLTGMLLSRRDPCPGILSRWPSTKWQKFIPFRLNTPREVIPRLRVTHLE